jgi:hypothetical protein
MPKGEIQSVLFPNDRYTSTEARAWLKKHHIIPMKRVHRTMTFFRYRIKPPEKYNRFKTIGKEIKFVIGYK